MPRITARIHAVQRFTGSSAVIGTRTQTSRIKSPLLFQLSYNDIGWTLTGSASEAEMSVGGSP